MVVDTHTPLIAALRSRKISVQGQPWLQTTTIYIVMNTHSLLSKLYRMIQWSASNKLILPTIQKVRLACLYPLSCYMYKSSDIYPTIWKEEASRSQSSVLSTQQLLGHPGKQSEILSQSKTTQLFISLRGSYQGWDLAQWLERFV